MGRKESTSETGTTDESGSRKGKSSASSIHKIVRKMSTTLHKTRESLRLKPISATVREGNKISVATSTSNLNQRCKLHRLDVNPVLRLPLIAFNGFFWAIGYVMMSAGAYEILEALPLYANHGYTLIALLVVKLEIGVALMGCVLFLVSVCGCVGSIRENIRVLKVYSSLITAVIVILVMFGATMWIFPYRIKQLVHLLFSDTVIIRYRDNVDFQTLVDYIQYNFHCCGFTENGFREWDKNIYFKCQPENLSPEKCGVPFSCCRHNRTAEDFLASSQKKVDIDVNCGRGILELDDLGAWETINTMNCVDAILRYVSDHSFVLSCALIACCLLLGLILMLTHSMLEEIEIIRRICERYERFIKRKSEKGLSSNSSGSSTVN